MCTGSIIWNKKCHYLSFDTDVLLFVLFYSKGYFSKPKFLKIHFLLCMFLGHSSSDMVKKIKVDDVYFTSTVFVSSRSFIQQEVCEGTYTLVIQVRNSKIDFNMEALSITCRNILNEFCFHQLVISQYARLMRCRLL